MSFQEIANHNIPNDITDNSEVAFNVTSHKHILCPMNIDRTMNDFYTDGFALFSHNMEKIDCLKLDGMYSYKYITPDITIAYTNVCIHVIHISNTYPYLSIKHTITIEGLNERFNTMYSNISYWNAYGLKLFIRCGNLGETNKFYLFNIESSSNIFQSIKELKCDLDYVRDHFGYKCVSGDTIHCYKMNTISNVSSPESHYGVINLPKIKPNEHTRRLFSIYEFTENTICVVIRRILDINIGYRIKRTDWYEVMVFRHKNGKFNQINKMRIYTTYLTHFIAFDESNFIMYGTNCTLYLVNIYDTTITAKVKEHNIEEYAILNICRLNPNDISINRFNMVICDKLIYFAFSYKPGANRIKRLRIFSNSFEKRKAILNLHDIAMKNEIITNQLLVNEDWIRELMVYL